MSLVNTETGEIVVPLTRDEAQALTAKIKGYVSQAWLMLVEAHDRHAHIALGYSTWADYVQAEFEIGRSRSYQILDQARVIRELDAVSTDVDTDAAGRMGVSYRTVYRMINARAVPFDGTVPVVIVAGKKKVSLRLLVDFINRATDQGIAS